VVAVDAAGNTTTHTTSLPKDTVAPGTPVLTFPTINGSSASAAPVSGTVAGSFTEVEVWVTDPAEHETLHKHLTPSGGGFTTTFDLSALDEGPLTAHAQATDGSNVSPVATLVATKDTVAPGAPGFAPPQYVNIATAASVPLTGTSEPGSSIALTVTSSGGAGQVTKTIPVSGSGTWTAGPDLDLHTLADGTLTFTAVATDAAGNAGTPATHTDVKDTQAPATPSAPGVVYTATTTPTVTTTGSRALGDAMAVTITSDGDSGVAHATGADPATDSTAYSIPVEVSGLADGTLAAVVRETDAAGNVSAASPAATVIKDTTALAFVSSSPAVEQSVADPAAISATYNEQLSLGNSTVALKAPNGNLVSHGAASQSDDKKTISFSPSSQLAEGSGYDAIFAVKDASGAEAVTTHVLFTVDRTAPLKPTAPTLGDVTAGNVTVVPVSGIAVEPGGTVTIAVTDGIHTVSATAPAAAADAAQPGGWSTVMNLSPLTDGGISAKVEQTDEAANASPLSDPATATKDTLVPAAPTLHWSANALAGHQTVTFSGGGEVDQMVHVYVDDTLSTTPAVGAITPTGSDGLWSTSLDVSSLHEGSLTATAWVTDEVGNIGATRMVGAVKDTSVPTVSLTSPAGLFTLGRIGAHWSGGDTGSGVAAYDVRYAHADRGKALSSYRRPAAWQGLAPGVGSVTGTTKPGATDCFEVRVRDTAGNVSGWTAPRCSTVALDDRALTASPAWKRINGGGFYRGTATTTTIHGATLTLPRTTLDRVAFVARHCGSCGTVTVYVGSTLVKKVNLQSATTRAHVLTLLPAFSRRTGVVTLRVTSVSGETVQIDAIGTSRL